MRAGVTSSRVRGPKGLAVLAGIALTIVACSSPAASTTAPAATAAPSAAAAVTDAPAAPAYPEGALSIMAPAAPGGGWDSTARALQKAADDAGLSGAGVEVFNVAGAGGTVGLAQYVEQAKGDPESLMVMGLVMVGAIRTNQAPVDLSQVTPIASLTAEWEAVAVKADSKYQTLEELVADFKAEPTSIAWGGGSAGGTDQILVGLIAKAAGVDPAGINYVAYSGGGEALDGILSGAVTAGVSGASEFADQVAAGAMRYLAISADARVEGIDAPTIKDAGLDVELANWRGIVAAPGLDAAQREAVVGFVTELHDSDAWKAALETNGWMDFFKPGDEFDAFLADEIVRVEGVLKDIGLIQ